MFSVFVNREWLEGPIYPTCSGIWRNWLNCQVIVIHGKCQAWNSIEPQRLHTRVPRWKWMRHMSLIVQYAVKWCGATIISYSTPAFLTRHCKPEYIRLCLELDALQQVNIAVITPDSMICAFDLCVCTVKRRQSKPEHTLKIPETCIFFTFARSEEYPREALPRGAGGCLSEVLL